MNERERLVKICQDLHLPNGQWVLSGSGIMVMHGIERTKPMGDVDIFVATRQWMRMHHFIKSPTSPSDVSIRPKWKVFTTDPDDPKRRCDPPYLYRDMYGIEVNVFSSWRRRGIGDLDVNFLIHNAELVDGIPCYPLQLLLDWKLEVGRAKDLDDIRILKEHLA